MHSGGTPAFSLYSSPLLCRVAPRWRRSRGNKLIEQNSLAEGFLINGTPDGALWLPLEDLGR